MGMRALRAVSGSTSLVSPCSLARIPGDKLPEPQSRAWWRRVGVQFPGTLWEGDWVNVGGWPSSP